MFEEMSFNEDAVLALVHSMAAQISEVGLAATDMMMLPNLTDEQLTLMMKSNLFLTAFAMLLIDICKYKDVNAANSVMSVWTADKIRELTQVAYAEEIHAMKESLANDIQDIENWANKDADN